MIKAFSVLGHTGIGDPSQLSGASAKCSSRPLPASSSPFRLLALLLPRARAAKGLHDIQDTMNALFRKMPMSNLPGPTSETRRFTQRLQLDIRSRSDRQRSMSDEPA
jgi:hypothetical protein